ncbi:MAG: glycosyltransferase [Elusimicrobiota bacterium]
MRPLSIFIPVYNEEELLAANVEKVRRHALALKAPFEIIIGSNGSSDRTPDIGRGLEKSHPEIRFFHLPRRGPGAAFKKGLEMMRYDVLISLDADLSVDLDFISAAARALDECDFVVGSKKTGRERRTPTRTLASDLLIFCSKALLGLPFEDYSLGAKAYRKQALLAYRGLIDEGTFYVQNILYRAWKDGLKIRELPVHCEDFRKSRFNLVQEGLYRFGSLFGLWFREKWRPRRGDRTLRAYFFAAGLLLSGVSRARAGFISLESSTQVDFRGRDLTISITAANRGNDTAQNLQAEVSAPGSSWSSAIYPTLAPGQPLAITGRLRLGPLDPGLYPILIKITYTDANRYPFSALSAATFSAGIRNAAARVWLVAHSIKIGSGGRLNIGVKNLDGTAKSISLRLFLPNELSGRPGDISLTLAPQEITHAAFHIGNFSALPGSAYPSYVVAQYTLGGVHYTTLAEATVSVGPKSGWKRAQTALAAAIALLVLLLAFLNVRTPKTRK